MFVFRGLCLFGRFPPSGFIRMAAPIPPTSSVSTSSNRRVLKGKHVQWVSGNFPSKRFSTSVTDVTRARRRERSLKDSSEGSSQHFFFFIVPVKFISTSGRDKLKNLLCYISLRGRNPMLNFFCLFLQPQLQ